MMQWYSAGIIEATSTSWQQRRRRTGEDCNCGLRRDATTWEGESAQQQHGIASSWRTKWSLLRCSLSSGVYHRDLKAVSYGRNTVRMHCNSKSCADTRMFANDFAKILFRESQRLQCLRFRCRWRRSPTLSRDTACIAGRKSGSASWCRMEWSLLRCNLTSGVYHRDQKQQHKNTAIVRTDVCSQRCNEGTTGTGWMKNLQKARANPTFMRDPVLIFRSCFTSGDTTAM